MSSVVTSDALAPPKKGGTSHYRLLTSFYPSNAHSVNLKMLHSRGHGAPVPPPPSVTYAYGPPNYSLIGRDWIVSFYLKCLEFMQIQIHKMKSFGMSGNYNNAPNVGT